MIPTGTHAAVVTSSNLVIRGDKDAIAVRLQFPDCENQTLTWHGYMSSDGATGVTVKAMNVCGWDPLTSEPHPWNLVHIDKGEESVIVGAKVECVISHDDSSGTNYANVDWINERGGRAAKLSGADRRKALMERMSGQSVISDDEVSW